MHLKYLLVELNFELNSIINEICFYLDKIYENFVDTDMVNRSEFRIIQKHAVGTTLFGPGFIFDLNRVVQTIHSMFSISDRFVIFLYC